MKCFVRNAESICSGIVSLCLTLFSMLIWLADNSEVVLRYYDLFFLPLMTSKLLPVPKAKALLYYITAKHEIILYFVVFLGDLLYVDGAKSNTPS